tara:strand:- start:133 stop:495 length:363 start_codon:yes stop_codon:yes gene_type:complete
MILLNVGSSFLMQDIMPVMGRFFQNIWIRRLVFFAIFFTATRNLLTSILLTLIFTLIIDLFLNEKSSFCMIPYEYRQNTNQVEGETSRNNNSNVEPFQNNSNSNISRFQRCSQNANTIFT